MHLSIVHTGKANIVRMYDQDRLRCIAADVTNKMTPISLPHPSSQCRDSGASNPHENTEDDVTDDAYSDEQTQEKGDTPGHIASPRKVYDTTKEAVRPINSWTSLIYYIPQGYKEMLRCFECGANARAVEHDGGAIKFFEGLKGVVSHMKTHPQWTQETADQLKQKIMCRSSMTVNQTEAYSNAKKVKSCKKSLRVEVEIHVRTAF
jgi:hypothetical protein